jgi:hypothetical protein
MNQSTHPASASTTSSSPGPSSGHGPNAAEGTRKGVADAATELGRDVTREAGNVMAEARHTVEARVSTTKDRAAEGLDTFARALHKTGEHLKTDEQEMVSAYVGRAADQVSRLSSYLQSRTVGQVIGDVEGIARREPALFVGGAFVAGILGGRFLKSSAARSSQAAPQGVYGANAGRSRSVGQTSHAQPSRVQVSHVQSSPRSPSQGQASHAPPSHPEASKAQPSRSMPGQASGSPPNGPKPGATTSTESRPMETNTTGGAPTKGPGNA